MFDTREFDKLTEEKLMIAIINIIETTKCVKEGT